MRLGDPLPSLEGASSWLKGRPQLSAPECGAVLVHFWSTGCPLCHEGVVDIARWRARFAQLGLVTIGVYQLRERETFDPASAEREALIAMHIDYPCALDAVRVLAARFQSDYPPGYYIFDGERTLRHRQMGNASLHAIDAIIERILS